MKISGEKGIAVRDPSLHQAVTRCGGAAEPAPGRCGLGSLLMIFA
jgi:hypothetical protein